MVREWAVFVGRGFGHESPFHCSRVGCDPSHPLSSAKVGKGESQGGHGELVLHLSREFNWN